jgi:glutathione S-transferase
MKLYYHHLGSPTVRKVRAVAFELELVLEEIHVDWQAGEHRSPWYLALNPNAKFPTLVDGDFSLWESSAICQYLATQAPEKDLLPREEKLRAEVTRWQCWEIAHFVPPAQKIISHNFPERRVDEAQLRAYEDDFRRYALVLDDHLRERQFLVGERLTVADFCVASMLMYAERGKLPINGLTNLARWFATVEKRRGWQRSAPPPA